MTADNGWPDPPRKGVPLHPERDGFHWVTPGTLDDAFPAEWRAAGECEWGRWGAQWIVGPDEHDPAGCRYLGLCLTPAEVAAAVAQAVQAERNRIVAIVRRREADVFARVAGTTGGFTARHKAKLLRRLREEITGEQKGADAAEPETAAAVSSRDASAPQGAKRAHGIDAQQEDAHLAAAVAQARQEEREACARLVEEYPIGDQEAVKHARAMVHRDIAIAAAIRARAAEDAR